MIDVTVQSIPITVTVQDQAPIVLAISSVGTPGPAGTTSWNGITDKPTSFSPSTHGNEAHTVPYLSSVSKSDVGLGNADNTSDANKPISTATQNALDLKEGLNSMGTATLAFGSFPGSQTASVTVTGQTNITASDIVYLTPIYSTDENRLVASLIDFSVGVPVSGTSFTIYAISQEKIQGNISIGWRY